jgi:hypothetical protein
MLPDNVTVHRRASVAYDVLPPAERKRVQAKFDSLRQLTEGSWS